MIPIQELSYKMKFLLFNIKSKIWLYPGRAGWHFVTIEKETADEIRRFDSLPRRGFGSIKVQVTIGKTIWKTSIFPDKEKSFVLPIKKSVREKENLKEGDLIPIAIELIN